MANHASGFSLAQEPLRLLCCRSAASYRLFQNGSKQRSHALVSIHHLDQLFQEALQCVSRVVRGLALAAALRNGLQLFVTHHRQQIVSCREAAIERSDAHLGMPGYVLIGRGRTILQKQVFCRDQYPFAVSLSVGSQRSPARNSPFLEATLKVEDTSI